MTSSNLDSIVIGGGLAGLTAARDLATAGHSCLLLESSHRLGGRTWYRPFAGAADHMVELGGTFVSRRFHPLVYAEVERYGLRTVPPPGSTASPRHMLAGQRLNTRIPILEEDLHDAEHALVALLTAARRIRLGVGLDAQDLADLDVPLRAYVDGLNVSPGVSELILSWGWNMTGQPVDEASAIWLLQYIAAHDSVLGVATSVDEVFEQGTASLVDALANEIPDVRTDHSVVSVAQDADSVTVRTEGGESFTARSAVLAVPLNKWSGITFTPPLSEDQQTIAREGLGGRGLKLFIWASGVPEGCHGSAFGGQIPTIYDYGPLGEGRLLVAFSETESLDPHDRAGVEQALRQFVPDARVLAVDGHDWSADQHFHGSWTSPKVGQFTRIHAGLSAMQGRVAVAGADVSTSWPGYIEGALESGGRAAQEVTELLSRSDGRIAADRAVGGSATGTTHVTDERIDDDRP